MATKKQQDGFDMCLRTAAKLGWAFMITPVELEDGTYTHVSVRFDNAGKRGKNGLYRMGSVKDVMDEGMPTN